MANGQWPFQLKIDGQILKDAMISRLEIRQELGAHYWLDVEFRLINQQQPPVASYLGKSIEFIALEYLTSEVPIFSGIALEAEMEYGLHEDFIARLRGVTQSYKLQLTPEENYFYQKSLKVVAGQVMRADEVEVQFNVDGEWPKENYLQWRTRESDFIDR